MDYFNEHGVIALICLAVFPRLTLLFASFAFGGWLWWLGWVFTPHLLVAFLSLAYWDQNPVLVVFAWIIAIGGTGGESHTVKSRGWRDK